MPVKKKYFESNKDFLSRCMHERKFSGRHHFFDTKKNFAICMGWLTKSLKK